MVGQKAYVLRCNPDALILNVLSIGLMHGYGVGQRVTQLAEELLTVEEGSLYPALDPFEERGLVESDRVKSVNNRRARFYKLTTGAQGARRRGVELATSCSGDR